METSNPFKIELNLDKNITAVSDAKVNNLANTFKQYLIESSDSENNENNTNTHNKNKNSRAKRKEYRCQKLRLYKFPFAHSVYQVLF